MHTYIASTKDNGSSGSGPRRVHRDAEAGDTCLAQGIRILAI